MATLFLRHVGEKGSDEGCPRYENFSIDINIYREGTMARLLNFTWDIFRKQNRCMKM